LLMLLLLLLRAVERVVLGRKLLVKHRRSFAPKWGRKRRWLREGVRKSRRKEGKRRRARRRRPEHLHHQHHQHHLHWNRMTNEDFK